jgi:hypothetical protein
MMIHNKKDERQSTSDIIKDKLEIKGNRRKGDKANCDK